jgi:hypothetical protein
VTDHTRTILEKAATIAVVGLSANDTKAAHAVPAFLRVVVIGATVLRYGIPRAWQVSST